MASQAMESMTRAFYARADLDLILASPVAVHRFFAVRIATVALSVALTALPLAVPFIDMLVVRGGWRWLGAYGVIAAMGAAAAAFAVVLTAALFHACGPKRTRLVAQVVAAVVGAIDHKKEVTVVFKPSDPSGKPAQDEVTEGEVIKVDVQRDLALVRPRS
ncbi:MAG TPA: hypothetical protein VNY79_09395, partial [Xanthobacteraceae bacterium]|nr:hypothetical protein [Xanthobacteraceae bacterium]